MGKMETNFRARLRPRLEAIPNSWWESIQQQTIHGTPDIIGCIQGYFVAIEVKATADDKPAKIQQIKLDRIRFDAQGIALVIHPDNMEESLEFLNKLGRV